MTTRVIADSPADGWWIGLVMNDTAAANAPPPAGTVLTGVEVVGPTSNMAFVTLNVTVNTKQASFQAPNGLTKTFPINPPMAIETGLGFKGTGWRIAGITDSLTVLDPAGDILAAVSA